MGKLRQDDSGGRGRWGVGEGEWGWQQDVVNLCALLGRLPVFTLLPDNDGCGHLQEVEKTTSCKSFHLQALLASSLWGDCFALFTSACPKIDSGHWIFWMTPTCFIINCLHMASNDRVIFEMVVEEKERLATATGLPSYKEACPDTS